LKNNIVFTFALLLFGLCPYTLLSKPHVVGVQKLNKNLDALKRIGASYQAYFAKGEGSTVYGAYDKNWVGSYDLKKKKWIWFYKTGSHLSADPVVTPETVSFALRDGTVLYLKRASGDLVWKASLPAFVNQPMVAAQGELIVQTSESKTYALSRQTGDIVWVFESPIKPRLSLASAPAAVVTPALVFVGDASGFVYGVDRSSGRAVWRFFAGGSEAQFSAVVGSMHLDGTSLWLARTDGMVHKVDPRKQEDAAAVWTKKFDEDLSSAKFSEDRVFLGFLKGSVKALDKKTGSVSWSRRVYHDIVKLHYLDGNTVVVGPNCETSILSAKTGAIVSSFDLDGYCTGSVLPDAKGFYVSTGYKNLYKIKL